LNHREVISAIAVVLALPWLAPLTLGPAPWVLQSALTGLMVTLAWVRLMPIPDSHVRSVGTAGLAWSLVIAAVLSSGMAIGQLTGWTADLQPWVSASDGVGYANLRQRNLFADLTVLGFAALLYLSHQPRAFSWLHAALGSLGAVALTMGNVASASRTGLVGVGLLVGWGALWWRSLPRLTRWLIGGALPLYGVIALVLVEWHVMTSTAFTRLAQGDVPCSSRVALWSNVMHLIAQRPWTGWGWGELAYAHFVTLYDDTRFCAILDNAHNLPLHLAVAWGAPIAALVSLAAFVWVARARPWTETEATRQFAWAMLSMLVVHSALEYPLWYGPFQGVALASLAMLWRRRSPEPDARRAPANTPLEALAARKRKLKLTVSLYWKGCSAMVLIAFFCGIAWDYHRMSQVFLPYAQRSAAYRDDTLNKIRNSWLFQAHVQFAELTTTPLTPANAAQVNTLAKSVLHFSPESVVIQKVVESAVMLGQHDEALYFLQRFQAAYPAEHKAWADQVHEAAAKLPH